MDMIEQYFVSPVFDEITIWLLFEKWANDSRYMPNTEENRTLNLFRNYVLDKTNKRISYYLLLKAGGKPTALSKKDIEDLCSQLFTLWQARLLVKIRNGNTIDKTVSLLFIFNKARKNLIKEVLEFNQITRRLPKEEGKPQGSALIQGHKALEESHIKEQAALDGDTEADFNWFIARIQPSMSAAEYKWIMMQKAFATKCLEDADFARVYNSDFAKFLEEEAGKAPTNARRIKSENQKTITNCLANFCKSNIIEVETALTWFRRLFFLFMPIFSRFIFTFLLF